MRLAELFAGLEYLTSEKFTGRVTYWVETKPGESSEMRRTLAEHFDATTNGNPALDPKREAERFESFRSRIGKWCDRPTSPLNVFFRAGRITKLELIFLLCLLLGSARPILKYLAPSRARKLEAAVNIMEVIGHQIVRVSMIEEQLQRLQQQNQALVEENKKVAGVIKSYEQELTAPGDGPPPIEVLPGLKAPEGPSA